MNDFPRMIYKAGGTEDIHGGKFTWHIVHDAEELDAALAADWHLTTAEAGASAVTTYAPEVAQDDAADNAPPTRAELEQKAAELGIEFSPKIGDVKLAERIASALAKD